MHNQTNKFNSEKKEPNHFVQSFMDSLFRMIEDQIEKAVHTMVEVPFAEQQRDPLMKSKDAARYLCIHPNTFYSYVHKGLISVDVRAGNKHLFRKSTLDHFSRSGAI